MLETSIDQVLSMSQGAPCGHHKEPRPRSYHILPPLSQTQTWGHSFFVFLFFVVVVVVVFGFVVVFVLFVCWLVSCFVFT